MPRRNSTRVKVMIFNIIAIILFFIAIAWNIKVGGLYNLEIAIGALILGAIKIWQEFLS
jgi:hypothetical protein